MNTLGAFLNQTPNDEAILVISGAILAGLCVTEIAPNPPFIRAALFIVGLVLLIIGLVGMVTD